MAQANAIDPDVNNLSTDMKSPSLSGPEQDYAALHQEDRAAGAAVAAIMVTIFLLAVVGYTIIALLVASGPS
jgi:hypothetical protein